MDFGMKVGLSLSFFFEGIITFGSSGDFIYQSRMLFEVHMLCKTGLVFEVRTLRDIVACV